jgi:hypothetical protein
MRVAQRPEPIHRLAVMRAVGAAVICMLLIACSGPMPTASPNVGSPPPSTALAQPPPPKVQSALARAGITFVPLTAAQLARVRVTITEAKHTAFRDRSPGTGSENAVVVWKTFGCVFLGRYRGEIRDGTPRTFSAYLVQALGDPVPDYPVINIGVVVVDAETGVMGSTYSGGEPPNGMMGTTCGHTP